MIQTFVVVEQGNKVSQNAIRQFNDDEAEVVDGLIQVKKDCAEKTLWGGENWNNCYPTVQEKDGLVFIPYRPA